MPGPSAVTMAVALSGLPTDRFSFDGFPPRTAGARQKFYESLRFDERTLVFFEAPHRLEESLTDALATFGSDRKAAICREMTKHYEQTIRGDLSALLEWSQKNEILGEITLVIAGAATDAKSVTTEAMVARVQEFESAGMDRKAAIAAVAEEFSLPKRSVYAAVVDANKMGK